MREAPGRLWRSGPTLGTRLGELESWPLCPIFGSSVSVSAVQVTMAYLHHILHQVPFDMLTVLVSALGLPLSASVLRRSRSGC